MRGNVFLVQSELNVRPTFLFVLPWSVSGVGGVGEVVKNLYRKLRNGQKFTPAILAAIWNSEQLQVLPEFDVSAMRLRSPLGLKRSFYELLSFVLHLPVSLWALKRFLDERNVAVVNAHYPELSCLHFVLLKMLGAFRGQFVVSFHGSDIRAISQTKGIERAIWRFLLNSADGVVTCSQSLSDEVIACMPSVAGRVTCIRNGVEADGFFGDGLHPHPAFVKIGDRPFILSVGAFRQVKGHDLLLRAFHGLAARYPELCLVLIGGAGPTSQSLRELGGRIGLRERVHILEDVPHSAISWWMKNARIFVLASRSESLGIVLLEAGLCGVPVIASRVGGIPEILSDGITGRLVTPEDVDGFTLAMMQLLENPEEGKRLGNNLQQRVLSEFTWQSAYERYLELISGVRHGEQCCASSLGSA